METFFTSDIHFGHTNIIKFCGRPWDNVEEMNEGIIDLWNAQVAPNDRVFILGDFAMGKLAETIPLGRRMNGRKVLIGGNHDRFHPAHHNYKASKADEWMNNYITWGGFETVIVNPAQFKINGLTFWMAHFPWKKYYVDGREGRHDAFSPDDDGTFLVHGHVHQEWGVDGINRMFNVGLDAWGMTLVPFDDIKVWIDGYGF